MITDRPTGPRPCIALMGEFSAGKSTLANLLIGADPLPVQVVATQLPPVCISHGEGAAYSVDLDGNRRPVDLKNLAGTDLGNVTYLQIFSTEEMLQHCDLLDMPGISDPNMSSEVWQRMIDKADGVLWCSHATQAWRQSEAAVWAEMPEGLRMRSLLLLTRIDKLQGPSDRARVLTRVKRETEGLFADVLPISLLTATQEQGDYALWSQSGAEAFATRLISLLAQLNAELAQKRGSVPTRPVGNALRLPGLEAPADAVAPAPPIESARILPRRVRRDDPPFQRR